MKNGKGGSGGKGPTDYRDSKTGLFVPPGYAKKHPSTTEGEHNRPPPKKPK
jgi:hypothetical protein